MIDNHTSARFLWKYDDPEIVSDVLFAVANVVSFARTTYLMPAFEALGPLQISFTRMLTDITRFMVLYLLLVGDSEDTDNASVEALGHLY
ncbi:uncharacterized protein DEA37_0007168 [Paragonimus westermani]|uniref:Ion transport domain-containing protein n=1 Tax=Paragonimus westermani TaxID=34504 RepID=A0A5J4P1N9_9TREM|nr:uncharacterized protein DEA37_0007168 [Paragonimus westermani]